jgi:hypothetical protein
MKNLPNFLVDLNGSTGEIFVTDNHDGKFMCVFVKTDATDFSIDYNAYGFMVWTAAGTNTDIKFYPIKLQEQTLLTNDIMREMWNQIVKQIPYFW